MIDFFEFSNEMLCLANQQGYLTKVNPAWTRTLGWSSEELTNRPYIDFVHPDDLAATLEEARLLLSGNHETVWFENRYRCRDGSYRWLAWKVNVIQNTDVLACAARDVTEQKSQARALAEAEERFRVLATQAPVGIVQSDKVASCVFVNENWHLLTGLSSEESLGYGWKKAIHPDDLPRVMEKWEACVRETREYVDEYRLVKKNGGVRSVIAAARATKDTQGNVVGFIGTFLDITERNKSEKALQESEQALRTEQDLLRNLIKVQEQEKQFLCSEFHDGLIQFAVGSLMLLQGCHRNPQSQDNASKINTAISNLRRGIEDGRRVIRGIRPAVLDDSGLEAAIEDLVGQFETSEIHVVNKCDPGIGRLPESVQTTIYRVVQEALNNASKYSGTDVVRIELRKVNGELQLEVRDFGCGFDVESARTKGFGLQGMTERVRLLSGECLIKSEQDAGTCISVRLPIPEAVEVRDEDS